MSLDVRESAEAKKSPCWLFRNASRFSTEQNRLINLFFYVILAGTAVAMLGIILYYVYAFASLYHGNEQFNWLLGIFSDFVSIMNAALADAPYVLEDGASYPPIAIMVLYPFAWICKDVFASYADQEWVNIDELTSQVILHKEFWIALVLFFLISIVSILLIVIRMYKPTPMAALKISLTLLLSAPCVYAIMRGNTIYFALIFLLLFLLLYKDSRPWVREIAYLCLVIAGSIKIYPLFFGVLLLKEKRFFASFRVAVYFFVLFFLSFHFFSGGADGMEPFFENLGGFMSSDARLLSLRNLSVTSLLYKLFWLISPAATETVAFTATNLALLVLIFALATVTAIATRSRLSCMIIASGIIVLIPTISYFYILIFELIPFLEFLRSYDTLTQWKQRLYTVLFLFLFFTFCLLPQCFILHSAVVIAMMVIEEKEVLGKELLPRLRKRSKPTPSA